MRIVKEDRVKMAVAERRALEYLSIKPRMGFTKASAVADVIWPGHALRSQGAGAAASRILKVLEKKELVGWGSDLNDWGYFITVEGRKFVREEYGFKAVFSDRFAKGES